MLKALEHRGVRVIEDSLDADAVLIWSVLWAGRMRENHGVYKHYRDTNRPVLIVDIGSLCRGVTWKVAMNNITADGFYGHTTNLDMDRPRRLGLALGAVRARHPDILLAAQHHQSLQMQGLDPITWLQQQVTLLRQFTDRPMILRPHPRSVLDLRRIRAAVPDIKIQSPRPVSHTYDEFDLTFAYHAVVNHNSGVGIRSALAGCRTIVSESSLAHPVGLSIDAIEQASIPDRDQWLIEIAHTEYTLDELEQGLWLKRLREKL